MTANDRKGRLGFLVAALVFLVLVFGLWRFADGRAERRRLNHERCAEEASTMVAEFLRTNSAYATKGSLVRVAGSGYATPGPWNIQGFYYLFLNRSAVFTDGTEQLEIMVVKGESKGVSQPRPEYPVINVSIPELWE
jgi:hypothetical protein